MSPEETTEGSPREHLDPRQVILVGHRTSGKTTIGRMAADELGWEFVDLDRHIESHTGKRPAAIIEESEARFRRLEREHLKKLLARPVDEGRIIALGAGCELIPPSALCVWLWRQGWQETARRARARLRPEWSFEREVEWMRRSREPRWQEAAHLLLDVPRARTPRFASQMLASYVEWAAAARDSALAGRTWMVPSDEAELDRAFVDARGLGLAGVEVRSDLFDALERPKDDVLASLRSPDADWLRDFEGAAAFDIDLRFVDALLDSGLLERREPTQLLLSAHPAGHGARKVKQLVEQARRIAERAPAWAEHLSLKYAPSPTSIRGLERAVDLAVELEQSEFRTTFLPQGRRFDWLRPIFGHRQNATNYVPVGLRPSRLPEPPEDKPKPTPMDLQDWLPHLAGPPPEYFDGLLGDPVHTSMGDWWHRRAALAAGEKSGYVKISAGRKLSRQELARLLEMLHRLDIRGLSVTSPLKRRIPDHADNPRELEAINTLRRTERGWRATDTDEAGMRASLDAAEKAGIEPGRVAVIGRGGVAPAVRRAIEASDWQLIHHASARAGWGSKRPDRVELVVNAAGQRPNARKNAPVCDVWLDLHYHRVAPPPESVRAHLNGDEFFVAQAVAQREFWTQTD